MPEAISPTDASDGLIGRKAEALAQIRALANEASRDGWDGNAAVATQPFAVKLAEEFVRSLPPDVPMPEFAPEPNGSISLDWIRAKNRLFSLSVGASHQLAYAWLDGADRGHGVSAFDGRRIPKRILQGIMAITENDASLGTS